MLSPKSKVTGMEAALADCPPDTLVHIFKFHGGMTVNKDSIIGRDDVKVVKVGAKVRIILKCSRTSGSSKTVSIPISPWPSLPFRDRGADTDTELDPGDFKARILEMSVLAQEGLGLLQVPLIDKFRITLNRGVVIVGMYMALLLYLHWVPMSAATSSPSSPLSLSSSFWAPARTAVSYPYVARGTRNAYNVTMTLHVLESAYTYWLCCKHRSPLSVTVQYVAATVLLGYTIWVGLRRDIKAVRVEALRRR